MTDLSKFKDIYLSETEDMLARLNANMLELEKNVGANSLNIKVLDELMRAAHTVKGSSATMGYNKLAFLMHVLEDVFDGARNQVVGLTQEILDALFFAIDNIEKSVSAIKKDNQEIDIDNVSQKIKNLTGVETEGTGKSVRTGSIVKKKNISNATNNIEAPNNNLVDSGEEESTGVSSIDYIKVPIERIDALMDLTEELLIDKMKVEQLAVEFPKLREVANHLGFVTSSIQYRVMQTRLVPVEQVFSRFPRMIRDLGRKLNKKIDFKIVGSEIELDRTIVDTLGEPLVHLLRNAADHGIVDSGYIEVRAARESDFAIISVENSGNRINFEKVREHAIKRGIISEKEATAYNEQQLINLLFHPRFSTRDEVTETSGRGVGLSVVKQFTDSMGGRVIVENLSSGVRFTMELPLTLAIINALFVEVDGEKFAIPFANIDRSVSVRSRSIRKMGDHEIVIVDGVDIPLIRLNVFFGKKNEAKDEEVAVLIRRGKDYIGVAVDKLLNEQEIIVKPLATVLRGVRGFSGSTIIGDGSTVLILDILNLIKSVK